MEELDLYSLNVAVEILKLNNFTHFSRSKKSIPNIGSPCLEINKVNFKDFTIDKVIKHRNGEITLKTKSGNLRFLKL